MTNAMISVVLFGGCGPLIVGASPLISPRTTWPLSRELLVQANLIEFIGFLLSSLLEELSLY